jgi:prevent-host-death family protein
MKSFSTVDLSRKIGDVTHAVRKSPVTITQHSKPRFVMMTVERFIELDPRKAARAEDLPHDLAQEMITAIDALLAN